MSVKNLVVIGDRVLIAPANSSEKTSSGLYLPQGVEKKNPVQTGIVIKTGPGYAIPHVAEEDEWKSEATQPKYLPLQVKEGDVAIFLKKEAIEVTYEDKEYLIVPQNAVLTVVRDPLLSDL